jgi:hypothetical protein
MTSRRRLTWNARSANAPAAPAVPGYDQPPSHPAAYDQPDVHAYENGDTSVWAEDPRPGPYTNSAPPANPGMDEPGGHPATDPAHYFPNGAPKKASRALQASLERKAARCIRVAERLLGRRATVAAVEDQAVALMDMTDTNLTATLRRMAEEDAEAMAAEEEVEAGDEDVTANYTLTPPRTARRRRAGEEEAVEADGEEAVEETPAKKAARFERLAAYWKRQATTARRAEEEVADEETDAEAEELLAEMEAEEEVKKAAGDFEIQYRVPGKSNFKPKKFKDEAAAQKWVQKFRESEGDDVEVRWPEAKTASARRRLSRRAGQNDPATYNYESRSAEEETVEADDEAEEILAEMLEEEASKKAGDEGETDAEAEELLAEMEAEEAKKTAAARRRAALKRRAEDAKEDDAKEDDEEVEEVEADEETPAEKKASRRALARKSLTQRTALRKRAEDEVEAEDEESEASSDKKAFALSAEEEAMLAEMEAEMTAEEEAPAEEAKEADFSDFFPEEETMLEDPMSMMEDPTLMDADDMALLYGTKTAEDAAEAKEADDEAKEADDEAKEADDEEPVKKAAATKAARVAGLRPKPRTPSKGARALGAVTKMASSSNEIKNLSDLWDSAPDVSKIFR